MNNKANIQIHFIFENALIYKAYVCHVPHPGDEVRFGGPENEKFYKVERVVWVYDEPENPFDRVNIGVTESA